MQANKNGFFYELDPATGKLISARPYAEMNWATGIDSNGRPMENAAVRKLKDATIVKPSSAGAHNWHPLSFDPVTGLVYMGVLDATSIQAVTSGWKINLHDQTTGVDRGYVGPVRKQWLTLKPAGKLVAWNPARSEEHTSNSSHSSISYAVFCLKKKKKKMCGPELRNPRATM